MNFLAPWFLLGAAAVAAPILFHLIRRTARERMPFSTLMFLNPTPPRVVRRRKLEQLWLLLLRCLGLGLLATAFARPFFPKENTLSSPVNASRQLILLLDTSASMRRENLWEQARARASQYLAQNADVERVAVLTFDQQTRTLVGFNEWAAWPVDQRAALAAQRLAEVSPGWMGTRLGRALTAAADQFADLPVAAGLIDRRDLVLISDLQEGSALDGLQGHEWPARTRVILESVRARQPSNAGLEILDSAASGSTPADLVRVRVANARDSIRDSFQLTWVGENQNRAEPIQLQLPPGRSMGFNAPLIPAGLQPQKLQLTGDGADFDNVAWFVRPDIAQITVAYFGSDSVNDPAGLRYYLERAFQDTPRRQVQLVSPGNGSPLPAELLDAASLAVIPAALGPGELKAVRDWLARGRTALLVLSDARMGSTLAALADRPDPGLTEAAGDFALLGRIDFAHPLFAPFADPRFSDFTHIHFWKHRRWEIPAAAEARVLAEFDDGSPALAQINAGRGTLLVLAAGWNPIDSQLAVSSKFVPLLQTLLDWSGGGAPVRCQFRTGDAIPAPVHAGAGAELLWQLPDGSRRNLAADAPFAETRMPGIYTAARQGKEWRFAVNLPLDESRTAVLSPDELAHLGVPLQSPANTSPAQFAQRRVLLQQAELENRQKVWRWLILGALAAALAEILLAGWLARRVKTIEVTA